MATTITLIEKYLFSDWHFLIYLGIVIALDTLMGIVFAIKSKSFSVGKCLLKLLEKSVIYAVFLVLTHVLKNFTINNQTVVVFSWIDTIFYSAVMVKEAMSVIQNIFQVKSDLLPTWILTKLQSFDTTGDINALKNNV